MIPNKFDNPNTNLWAKALTGSGGGNQVLVVNIDGTVYATDRDKIIEWDGDTRGKTKWTFVEDEGFYTNEYNYYRVSDKIFSAEDFEGVVVLNTYLFPDDVLEQTVTLDESLIYDYGNYINASAALCCVVPDETGVTAPTESGLYLLRVDFGETSFSQITTRMIGIENSIYASHKISSNDDVNFNENNIIYGEKTFGLEGKAPKIIHYEFSDKVHVTSSGEARERIPSPTFDGEIIIESPIESDTEFSVPLFEDFSTSKNYYYTITYKGNDKTVGTFVDAEGMWIRSEDAQTHDEQTGYSTITTCVSHAIQNFYEELVPKPVKEYGLLLTNDPSSPNIPIIKFAKGSTTISGDTFTCNRLGAGTYIIRINSIEGNVPL